jgi:tetratricopeptide (TPR) repeat protein
VDQRPLGEVGAVQTVSVITRRVYLAIMVGAAVFLAQHLVKRSDWFKDRLLQQMVQGDAAQQLRAATQLVQVDGEKQLLEALKNPKDDVRTVARKALEFLWFNAAGEKAYHLTEQAYKATEDSEYEKALSILNQLITKYPNFAEAYNRRASVYWEMGEFQKSISDSEKALSLNPHHYGALQGIGVCRLKMGDVSEACRCLRAALKIIPYDPVTQQSLRRCEDLLRDHPSPGNKPKSNRTTDLI